MAADQGEVKTLLAMLDLSAAFDTVDQSGEGYQPSQDGERVFLSGVDVCNFCRQI